MNTINRGLWVNETNDAYEMRVKNSCFNARANVRKRPCKIVVFYRTVNIIIARPINFLVFLLACVRSFANYYKTFGEEIICSRKNGRKEAHACITFVHSLHLPYVLFARVLMHVSYVHKGVTVLAGFVHVLTAFIHSQAHSFSYSHTLFTYNNTAFMCMNEAKERTRVHVFVSL